jgi:hypothetical protein
MKAVKTVATPFICVSTIIWISLANIILRSAVCGSEMQIIDKCGIPDWGIYVFPHSLLFQMSKSGLGIWTSISILISFDIFVTAILYLAPWTRNHSIHFSIISVGIFLIVSVIVSYLSVYYYLAP